MKRISQDLLCVFIAMSTITAQAMSLRELKTLAATKKTGENESLRCSFCSTHQGSAEALTAGAAVYQLGQFGTAAKKLKEWSAKP